MAHKRIFYMVYPPMYRAGDRTYKVYSMLQAKKIVKRCYNRGYPGGLGWEVWRYSGYGFGELHWTL